MDDILEVYDLEDNFIKNEKRSKFYEETKSEYAQTGKISHQVKTIRLILMNSAGRIYLQKRSKIKQENPGLYDKTIGGHVIKGYTYYVTVVKECAEELGFPAAILDSEEFEKAVESVDLSIIGIFKKVDYVSNFYSVRITHDGTEFKQPYMVNFYIGYYDGPIKFMDGESSGIESFTLRELEEDIEKNPHKFTEDIKFMLEKYKLLLKPLKKQYRPPSLIE